MTSDNATDTLLRQLAEAKTWSDRLQRKLDSGIDVNHQIREADKQIQKLEAQAKEAMKKLGCVSPQTRAVYQAMADMLIAWKMFQSTRDVHG
jgi:hypothetical protein